MVDGQHSRRDGGVPAVGPETARRASLEVSRRTLLGAVCASPALSVVPAQGGTPARPAPSPSHWDPGLRRDDESLAVSNWDRALARFHRAQAALAALAGVEFTLSDCPAGSRRDDKLYDRVLGRFNKALSRLLRTPAPRPAALAEKLDLLVVHQAWELNIAEPAFAALRRYARRLG